jgi:hypothetical protein
MVSLSLSLSLSLAGSLCLSLSPKLSPSISLSLTVDLSGGVQLERQRGHGRVSPSQTLSLWAWAVDGGMGVGLEGSVGMGGDAHKSWCGQWGFIGDADVWRGLAAGKLWAVAQLLR